MTYDYIGIKHIEIENYFFHKKLLQGEIKLLRVKSQNQLVGIFT